MSNLLVPNREPTRYLPCTDDETGEAKMIPVHPLEPMYVQLSAFHALRGYADALEEERNEIKAFGAPTGIRETLYMNREHALKTLFEANRTCSKEHWASCDCIPCRGLRILAKE